MTNKKATRKHNYGPQQQQLVLTEPYTTPTTQPLGSITSTATPSTSSSSVIVSSQDNAMINTLRPAKTKLGKARIRMKWTTEVNEYILRTYYIITQLETNCKHYRDTLHRLFNEEFPDVEVCAQRIADQRRAIVKNHLLTPERVEEIRREVEMQLQGVGGTHETPTTNSSSNPSGIGKSLSASSSVMATTTMVRGLQQQPQPQPPPTMTVWYGCVKQEQPDTMDAYSAAGGPSVHKMRKLNQDGVMGEGQPPATTTTQPNIIIHTTTAAAAAAALRPSTSSCATESTQKR